MKILGYQSHQTIHLSWAWLHLPKVHYSPHEHSNTSLINYWSLNWPISTCTATTFLAKKTRSSMVAYFVINLPLIVLFLSRRILHFYANLFGVRSLNLLLLLSPPSSLTDFLEQHSESDSYQLQFLLDWYSILYQVTYSSQDWPDYPAFYTTSCYWLPTGTTWSH